MPMDEDERLKEVAMIKVELADADAEHDEMADAPSAKRKIPGGR